MSSLNKVFNEPSSSETKGTETKGTGTTKTILQELMKERCRSESISEADQTAFPHVTHLQRYHPGLEAWDLGEVSAKAEASLPHPYQIVEWKTKEELDSRIFNVTLTDASNNILDGKAFIKTVHLLDPITLIRNEYKIPSHPLLPVGEGGWKTALLKLHSTSNQAYVDAVASFILGQLRYRGLTPHGCMSYGSFTGIAQNYRYKVTDEYESYRNARWFWRGIKTHGATLEIEKDGFLLDGSGAEFNILMGDYFKCPFDFEDEDTMEELITEKVDGNDTGSLCSFDAFDAAEETNPIQITRVENSVDGSEESSEEDTTEDEEDDDDENDDEDDENETDESDESDDTLFDVTLNLASMPVILICQEAQEGILDDLLELEEIVNLLTNKPVVLETDDWNNMWLAWLFQIIANLSFLQKAIAFTHNDLHTNNIVWRRTDQEFLYYRANDGQVWRVPTYGRIFSLIDFGRAIFKIKGQMWISDDHWPDHDAGGQYNFGPFYTIETPKILPNPSFDLSRLAISMLEGLFIDHPKRKKGSNALLSQEGSWKVYETVSPIFNLLWSWTIDDDGKTVYEDRNGEEKFPGFSLYMAIAHNVHDAVPKDQIRKPFFEAFKYKGKIAAGTSVYGLGC